MTREAECVGESGVRAGTRDEAGAGASEGLGGLGKDGGEGGGSGDIARNRTN